MKRLMSVVFMAILVPYAAAQSSSNAEQTSTSNSAASSAGNVQGQQQQSNSNSSSRSSTESNAVNQGVNSGSSSSAGGGAGGGGGSAQAGGGSSTAAGGNVTANIAPNSTINFNSPDTQRTISTSTNTSTLNTNVSGRTEQVISGEQTVRYEYSGTQTIKNVPSMNAPPLVSSNDTCMGSWSAGLAVAGFGASGGNTYTDEHCKRIKMSRELWNKGMKAASLALDCMDKEAREALEITGFVCPQTERARKAAEAEARPLTTTFTRSVPPNPAVPVTEQPAPAVVKVSDPIPVIVNTVAEAKPAEIQAKVEVRRIEPPTEESMMIRRVDLPVAEK